MSLDPFAVAVGVGFLGAVLGGPAVAFVLDSLPESRRRSTTWLLIGAGLAAALGADLLLQSSAGGIFVYLLAALPGLLTYLVFRSLVAASLISLAPMYFVIGHLTRGWPTHTPEIALDRAIGLQPEWMIVYGSLYVFILPLPMLVIRHPPLIRRAMRAFLMVMLAGYAGFALYPTLAPRPDHVAGAGFAAWCLRIAYDIDPPHGCMPSLHVAYSFVAALSCYRVHRGVGAVAALWAALIGVSTVFTKQHYVVDVIAGALLAGVAYMIFLRPFPFEAVPEDVRRRAPRRALVVVGLFLLTVAGFWIAYRVEPAAVAAEPQAAPLAIGETFTIPSKVLGEVRRINVYIPPLSKEALNTPLPVMYMPDGGMAEDFLHVAGLVQVSVGNGTMRPFILVGIENTERRRDMTGVTTVEEDKKIAPRVGGSDAFRRFIQTELMPTIAQRHRTTAEKAIVGESLAGLFVVETLLLQPDLFDTYIAFDPSLWWNDEHLVKTGAERLKRLGGRPRTLYLASSKEAGGLVGKFADVLRAAAPSSLRWSHAPMPEETHATIYHPAALKAFRQLFGPNEK